MKLPRLVASLTAGLLASTATTAMAQEAKGFGRAGELILSADRLLPVFSFTSGTTTSTVAGVETENNMKGSSFGLLWGSESGTPAEFRVHSTPRVGLDYVFIDHWTIGGSVAFAFGFAGSQTTSAQSGPQRGERTIDTPSTSVFGIAPRAGYILQLADSFAFWPRAGVSYYSASATYDRSSANTQATSTNTASTFALDLDPQFVFVPVEHIFLQFGPLLNIPLSGSYKSESSAGTTTASVTNDFTLWHFGVSAGLGAWFNLL